MQNSITLLNTKLTPLNILVPNYEEIFATHKVENFAKLIACKTTYPVFLSSYLKKASLLDCLHNFSVHKYSFLLKVYDSINKQDLGFHMLSKVHKIYPAFKTSSTNIKICKSISLLKNLHNYLFTFTQKNKASHSTFYFNQFKHPLPYFT